MLSKSREIAAYVFLALLIGLMMAGVFDLLLRLVCTPFHGMACWNGEVL